MRKKATILGIVLLVMLVCRTGAQAPGLPRGPLITTPLGEITLDLFHGVHGQVIAHWRAPAGLTTSTGVVPATGFAALAVVSITQASIVARIESDGRIVEWSPAAPHARGSWVRPTERDLESVVLRFECITAGTAGQTEPQEFTDASVEPGDTVQDGSAVWITRTHHELPEGSELAAIAALRADGWTHARPFGRDGILSPESTAVQRTEIDDAVLAVLRDPSVMKAARRLIRMRARDTRLQKAARLQEIANRQLAAAADLEGEVDP